MDLHQLFRYTIPSVETSYEFTPPTVSLHSERVLGPKKFNLGGSPDSPFTAHTLSTLSNSHGQYISMENFSGISPWQNLSFEAHSSVQQSPPSLRATPRVCSDETIAPQDASSSMKYTIQELESAPMSREIDEAAIPSSDHFVQNQWAKISKQQQPRVVGHECRQDVPITHPGLLISGRHHRTRDVARSDKRQKVTKDSLRDTSTDDVKQLLIKCAAALSDNRLNEFNILIQEAKSTVSINGAPIQRLGAYIVEGLVARKEASGTNIYRSLQCKETESKDLFSYMHILYENCPYFKFGFMAANGAIAEALKNEDHVHIIDFQIAQGTQWMTLIQALAARPSGPPHVRITGIEDPVSNARGDGLKAVGKRLTAISERFNIPVEFNPVSASSFEITREMLDIRPGEALAVNFTLQLQHTPDESVDVNNPRDGLLRMVKSLSPKVTTLVEQESNTNTTPFFMRFMETLDFYSTMFESIDVTLPRDNKERINLEQHCLARDIVNIVACEGKDRVERHELLGKWTSRLSMAGFHPFPLSSYINSVIRSLLGSYSNYTMEEKDGALLLGWKKRNLISVSAWN